MGIDDADVRDLGLDLKHSPDATELRLPSAIGCLNEAGLVFFGLAGLLLSAGLVLSAWKSPDRSIVPIVAAAIAAGVVFVLHRVVRWLRYGAVVRVTPDRLVIRKHWSGGEEPIAIALDQVRLEPDRRGIVVAGGRRKLTIGTGLSADARDAVAGFLAGAIAGHLRSDAGRPAEVAPAAGPATIPPEAVITTITARITTAVAAEDGVRFVDGPPVDGPAEEAAAFDPDLLLLALIRRCRQADSEAEPCVHLAPDIPPAMLYAALENYLEIRDDEVLLGIIGAPEKVPVGRGCALTTRRIYWAGKPASSPEGRPPRCRWLDYSSVPEDIGVAGSIRPAVVLGKGRRIGVAGGRYVAGALAAFLRAARSVAIGVPADLGAMEAAGLGPRGASAPFLGEKAAVPVTVELERTAARSAWPRVVEASRAARACHVEIRGFQGRFLASRAIVTPAIVGLCIVVYALTVAATMQEHPGQLWPDAGVMVAWGADFGPATLMDGETWRTFTNLFLHWGILHLVLNMYCLAMAGPIVERLFGHVSFAGLYLLSGLGGSIASLWYHPTVVSAGASGAIFGVFGALIGFLVLRENEIPESKLKPMASGALGFVAYNTIFGLGAEGIDMAAHFGGLVVGFVCGLLLTAVTPGREAAPGRFGPPLKRAAVLLACVAAMVVSWPKLAQSARGRIAEDPKVGREIVAHREAVEAWNSYITAARPLLTEFDRIGQRFDDTVDAARAGRIGGEGIARTMSQLKGDSERLGARIAGLSAGNGEIREVVRHMTTAQALQLRMLGVLQEYAEKGDAANPGGPGDLSTATEAYVKEFETIRRLGDEYFRAHSIEPAKKGP
jgi:rhomboid protease GluP